MDCTELLVALGVTIFLRLLPVIIQGSSTFGSEWIKEPICSSMKPEPFCCNYSCGSQHQLQDIDGAFFAMQVVSFVLLLIPLICCDCCVYCVKDKEHIYGCGVAVLVIQMVAGVLSLIGCIAIAVKFHGTFSYGSSFFQCLLCGIFVILTSLACIFCCVYTNVWSNHDIRVNHDNQERNRLMHDREEGGAYESA